MHSRRQQQRGGKMGTQWPTTATADDNVKAYQCNLYVTAIPHGTTRRRIEAPKHSNRLGEPQPAPKPGLRGTTHKRSGDSTITYAPPCMCNTRTQGTTRRRTCGQLTAHTVPNHTQT